MSSIASVPATAAAGTPAGQQGQQQSSSANTPAGTPAGTPAANQQEQPLIPSPTSEELGSDAAPSAVAKPPINANVQAKLTKAEENLSTAAKSIEEATQVVEKKYPTQPAGGGGRKSTCKRKAIRKNKSNRKATRKATRKTTRKATRKTTRKGRKVNRKTTRK